MLYTLLIQIVKCEWDLEITLSLFIREGQKNILEKGNSSCTGLELWEEMICWNKKFRVVVRGEWGWSWSLSSVLCSPAMAFRLSGSSMVIPKQEESNWHWKVKERKCLWAHMISSFINGVDANTLKQGWMQAWRWWLPPVILAIQGWMQRTQSRLVMLK
jgi:hypothetical protein